MTATPRHAPRDAELRLADGRRVTYRSYGPADGFPVLALHGTPGSRLKFSVTDDVAHELGLLVIAPDRWGYGGTDVHPVPTLTAFAEDMRQLADQLALARLAVLGISGGGPYAAAVATMLADRVVAAALVAPVGPIAGEPDREIGRFHRFCFGALASSRWAPPLVFRAFRRIHLSSPMLGMKVATARVGRQDRATLATPGVTERLAATFLEGLKSGAHGMSIDLALFGRRWSLPLANARCRSRLWIGTADQNVPVSAARRLASRLPGCDVVTLPGEGHFWIALNYREVLAWIAETTKAAGNAAASTKRIDTGSPQAVARPPSEAGA